MSKRVTITLLALTAVLASCARPDGPRTSDSIGGGPRYPTVRALLRGGEQPLPREQLLEIARFIRSWERDPFMPTRPPNPEEEPSTMALMLRWLTASPDVHVSLCPAVIAIAEQQAGEGAGAGFLMGAGFGMAAYMIENPEEAANPDSARVQGAGIESGLLWFEAYRERGLARDASILDELIEVRRDGGRVALQQYHAEHFRCGGREDAAGPGAP